MDILTSPQAWLWAGLIFLLRVINMAIATMRMMLTMRGAKKVTWFLGVFESLIFVVTLTYVVADLGNWLSIAAYALGFATGNSIGAWLEEKLAVGHINLRIISSHKGQEIVEHLRDEGFAVTEIPALGKDGTVTLLNTSVLRKRVDAVRALVEEIDSDAFMTAENMNPIRRGFWRS
ncbi:MAG: hypothetical protein JXB38_06655 [Anaerolineales bacterium]|nr:hypothetical protein [Anaerolineales bacterium]